MDHREDPVGKERTMTASYARRFLTALEPIASSVYFSPEVYTDLGAIGLEIWPVYFMGRAAPLGPVPAQVVTSTFFNWAPSIVEPSVRWDLASPEKVLQMRDEAQLRTLQRLVGEFDVARAAELVRAAVEAARPEGRTLYAAHLARSWPAEPLLSLWHGATLLREYRGDGHIAVLVSHGIDPVEAILMHHAYRENALSWVLQSRSWGDEAYKEGTARLAKRGFVNADGTMTDGGMKFRDMLEMETDKLAAAPFDRLGDEKNEELISLLLPVSAKIVQEKAVPKSLAQMAKGVAPVGL